MLVNTMNEYIELLTEINRFCNSLLAHKIVLRRDGITLVMQLWDNPNKTGTQIYNETLSQAAALQEALPNLAKHFATEVACNCIYLTSTVEE